mmetsp:Transcript_13450/g.31626  ORF Transcript_13450/g.31626 Transcript_13450/m.31626 type:complete len:292 (+) Transcript_13450:76-951(+)
MSSASSRVGQLLRRFQLHPSATREQLRAAYYDKAKTLHPDVAGKSSEAAFKRIKEEYEEAMKLLREVEQEQKNRAAGRSGPSSSQARYTDQQMQYEAWRAYERARRQQQWQQAAHAAQASQPEDQTAAQRIRNILLVSGSVLGAVMLLSRFGSGQRTALAPGPQFTQQNFARSGATVASDLAPSDGDEEDGELPVESLLARTESQRLERKVSDYYQRRTTKSTVRVRESDTYEPPTAPLRSRGTEAKQQQPGKASSGSSVGPSPTQSNESPRDASEAGSGPTAPTVKETDK